MTDIHKTSIQPYSSAQMFDLICDIPKYPQFLPWCNQAEILSQNLDKDSGNEIVNAKVYIKKGILKTSFTTRNTLVKNKSINMELIEGPFEYLHGNWNLIQLEEKITKIEFSLNYKFSNNAFSVVLKPVFNQISNMMLSSFCERAKVLYSQKNKT